MNERRPARAFWILCAAQCLLLVVLALGDVGFDKPGRFGLDFGHLLVLAALFALLALAGLRVALRARRRGLAGIQLLLLAVGAGVAWLAG